MKAVLCDGAGGPEVMQLREVAQSTLGPKDIRISVQATAVNRADILQRRGLYPPPKGASPVLGLECVGKVIELGERIGHTSGGFVPSRSQRVMALLSGGGYAEEVVVDVGSVLPCPDALSVQGAAGFMEVYLTAHLNLFSAQGPGPMREGQRLLVHGGTSGVGAAATALSKAKGVEVWTTCGSDAKCERSTAIGADKSLRYDQDDWAAALKEAGGADRVLDCVGAAYFEKNLSSLRRYGSLVLIGLMKGRRTELDLAQVLANNLSIVGTTLRSRSKAQKAELVGEFRGLFWEDLKKGALPSIVDSVFPLEDVAKAHARMESGEHCGKIVLDV